ncbi:MAG TPA: hypothetical protein ENI80_10580 [Acidiferrobacteraceae bacterium]|nr:hypothetical protein [Acidiferrobacteraceae bacterium]
MMSMMLMILSDIYRAVAALMDLPRVIGRKLEGLSEFDVACITNFENKMQKNFMGLLSGNKDFTHGLRFSVGRSVRRVFRLQGFTVSPVCNFGRVIEKKREKMALNAFQKIEVPGL